MVKRKRTRVGEILRDEGFVLLPPLWVRASDMPEIHKITGMYADKVNAVRAQVRKELTEIKEKSNPSSSRNAAWDLFERMRNDT